MTKLSDFSGTAICDTAIKMDSITFDVVKEIIDKCFPNLKEHMLEKVYANVGFGEDTPTAQHPLTKLLTASWDSTSRYAIENELMLRGISHEQITFIKNCMTTIGYFEVLEICKLDFDEIWNILEVKCGRDGTKFLIEFYDMIYARESTRNLIREFNGSGNY